MNNGAIGVFDSGLGGLTVVKQLIRVLPHEDIIYLGDTARVPYGPRGPDTIKRFSEENTRFLLSRNVKLIVIACNTSSAVAADFLKRKFHKTPIFEVIGPASKEAGKSGKRIGVIGTRATIGSRAYEKNIRKSSPKAKVFTKACPLLVPFIEEGEDENSALKLIVKDYLRDMKSSQVDTLIMGCTHYPIIQDVIEKEIGKNVKIIDPGIFVAEEVSKYLTKNKIQNGQNIKSKNEFYVTDLTERFAKVAEMFLGEKIKGRISKVSLNS
jgi:glutamate racemase